jgi:hypothetical protein
VNDTVLQVLAIVAGTALLDQYSRCRRPSLGNNQKSSASDPVGSATLAERHVLTRTDANQSSPARSDLKLQIFV